MKKIFSFIAILLVVCLIPITLIGCESNKSASQIADAYSKIQSKNADFYDSTTREFTVNFTSNSIRANMTNPSSQIYSLGKVYLPLLNSSMAFVNSCADKFGTYLKKFDQDGLNSVYAGMKDFEEALEDFATKKKSYENATSSGDVTSGYAAFLNSLKDLITSAQRFNIAFYKNYHKEIYSKDRNYKESGFTFTSADIKTEVLGNKLYLSYVLHNHYAKHYVWKTTNSIVDFMDREECSYLKNTIDILAATTFSTYTQSDEAALIALREGYATFVKDMDRAISYMKKVPYDEILLSNKEIGDTIDDLSQSVQDYYYAVENFMASRYYVVYNAVEFLSI